MSELKKLSGLLRLQQLLLWIVIAVFASAIISRFVNPTTGTIFCNISILVLILSAPVRLFWMSEYFRKENNRRYQILAYIVIIVIIAAILWKIIQ